MSLKADEIDTYANGLLADIEAVKNAIQYKNLWKKWPYAASCNVYLETGEIEFLEHRVPQNII